MRLRTFIAANMAEAIDQVRRELGSDAIIVSSFTNDAGRMEVTAAIETARPEPAGAGGPAGDLPEIEASLEQLFRDRLRATPSQTRNPSGHSGIEFDETLIAEALDGQGVPAKLRDALVAASKALGHDDAVAALARALETRLGFEPVPTLPLTPIMLVGLPGSGKTVTMAKLAANAVMEEAQVELYTTDTERAGAAAQCESYGQLLGLQVHPAENAEALTRLLQTSARSMTQAPRPRFIDTTSVNPFDRTDFAILKRLTDTARLVANAEPVLTLSATGDATLLAEVACAFAQLGARRIIATHVDISRRIGPLLAAADASRLSLAQISVTPYLARGLGSMNPTICARLILDTHEMRAEAKSLSASS